MSEKESESQDDGMPVLEEASAETSALDSAGRQLMGEESHGLAARLSVAEALFRHLTANLTFQEFMREVLMTLMGAVRCEAGSILEYSPENQHLFFRAAAGHSSDKIVNFTIPMGQGIAGHVAETRQPLLVSQAREHEKHLNSMPAAVGFETRNMIACPIVIRGKIFGVLELLNRSGEGSFTEQDFELVKAMTGVVARAVEVRLMISWAHQKARDPAGGRGTGNRTAA